MDRGRWNVRIDYILAPFAGWLVAGSLKFVINTVRSRELAWSQIGYGGLPSTHASIVSTTAFLVGLRQGFGTAAFCIAVTLAFVVIMDALSLRRHIGDHAAALNRLMQGAPQWKPLRESIGHRPVDVMFGLGTGLGCAWLLYVLL